MYFTWFAFLNAVYPQGITLVRSKNLIKDIFNAPFVSILESTIDAVFTIDAEGRIHWVNKAAERMFGWMNDELIGRNISLIVPSPIKEKHDTLLTKFSPDKGFSHVLGAGKWLEAQRKDGSRFPVEVGLSTFDSEGLRYFTGFVRDISERRVSEEKLLYLATHDQVTGLANGRLLVEASKKALEDSRQFALMTIVIEGMYRVRGRHGREGFLYALRTVSNRMQEVMNGEGVLARMDGELFAAMTSNLDPEAMAARLYAAVRVPITWGSIDINLGAVVGIAKSHGTLYSVDDLMGYSYAAARDTQVHHVQGGVSLFTSDIGRRLDRADLIEERLRVAVTTGGLLLALQPKVESVGGRILGAEALVRWHDKSLGTVTPTEFIPIAERAGIIGDLTSWVIKSALAEVASWQTMGLELNIAVNISAIDLRQPKLVEEIGDALARTSCDPKLLTIELTESALATNPDEMAFKLLALKELGVSLSLDDFGTGYSSLSYLRHFPFDNLKIDQSFVRDTPDAPDAVAIARTIVALARSLNMETVAEGVETLAQADFLCELGVDIFQGYYFSRPIPPDQFRTLALANLSTHLR